MTGLEAEAQAFWMLGRRLRAGNLEIALPNGRALRLSFCILGKNNSGR